MEILRQPLDVMVLPWATQKAASGGMERWELAREVNLRAESRSKGTSAFCADGSGSGLGEATANSQRQTNSGSHVFPSVCISAFSASEESLDQCKWMCP